MNVYHQEKLRLLKTSDYWWDVILGGLITLGIIIPIGYLLLSRINLDFLFYPFCIISTILVCFYQWKDDNLNCLKTNYSKEKNFDLVKQSLDKLKWKYNIDSDKVELTLNKYILKFLDPTIIIENGRILYNFKYHSTTKSGRLPFFFGIGMFLQTKFENELKKKVSTIS